jgi:RNA polymerase sigma factor (sigma-70 family)
MHDKDIVEAILAGEPAGFAAAYDRYGATLYAYCRSLLASPEDAANAVRDTYIIAIAKLQHLRDPERFRPWLYAIARNECHRRLHDRAAADVRAETRQATTGEFVAIADTGESGPQELVGAALAVLEPVVREIVELGLRHDLDEDGLAALLGVSRKQARTLASHAYRQFEASLGTLVTAGADWSLCQDLGTLLAGWNGEMTAALRRRLTEHIKTCGMCGVRRGRPPVNPSLWLQPPVVPRPRSDPDAPTGTRTQPQAGKWPGPRPGSPPGERRGPRHGSRSRRGSRPRRGSGPGPGSRPAPDERPAIVDPPAWGADPGSGPPAWRAPGSSLERMPTTGDSWFGPRDPRPAPLPASAWRRAASLDGGGDHRAASSADPADIAEQAGPFDKYGFPVPIDPPKPYRAPVRSALALAGVGALAMVAVAAMVTGTVHEGIWAPGPGLGHPADKPTTPQRTGARGTPGQTPAGVLPVATRAHGSSPPVPATIRSSKSAPASSTVTPGTLVAFPTAVTLQQSSKEELPTGSFTLTANDGPVSFSITVPAADAHDLIATPSAGTLPAGESLKITVTLERRNGPPLETQLTAQPGGLDITVLYRAHARS